MLASPPVAHIDHQQILKEHFSLFYQILIKGKLIDKAAIETINGVERALSGIPFYTLNAILKYPQENQKWETCIKEQTQFFQNQNLPFAWFVDETSDPSFQEELRKQGFKDGGSFQGVIGVLSPSFSCASIPDGWSLELVKNEEGMEEFQNIVSLVFSFDKKNSNMYKKVMWIGAQSSSPKLYHWLARHQGKAVSALTTLVMGEQVSFWNGASLPEYRRQGFSTALRRFALQDAVSKGCRIGMSYLMADALAFGICRQLGYETKWRFRIFISPQPES